MVVALVRSRHRLASVLSVLPSLPQASQLQPRRLDTTVTSNRRLHAPDKQTAGQALRQGKRMRMSCATMQASSKSSEAPAASDEDPQTSCKSSSVYRSTRNIADTQSSDFLFRLVCYNLLAQHQIEKNSYLYDHCKEEVLEWDFRRDVLLNEMKDFACDIMCLQEVQEDHYEDTLKPFFDSLGFESHFKNKTRSGHDGVAIVFRRSRFQLVDVELVEFHRPGHPALRADNVGVVMLLRPVDCPVPGHLGRLPPICVANTHLYFNANRGDVKLAQLSLLLASIERMARRDGSRSEHHPVLLCGDFNSEPTSPLFRFLESGRLANLHSLAKSAVSDQNLSAFWSKPTTHCLTSADLPPPGVGLDCRFREEEELEEGEIKEEEEEEVGEELSHPFRLASVYPAPSSEIERSQRRVTSFTAHDVCCVDHIFYTPDGLRLIAFRDTIRPNEFTRVAGIPNQVHSSDHIPLLVDFALQRSDEPAEGKRSHRL